MSKEFTHTTADSYLVTGVKTSGQRFTIATANPMHALGINLWRGSVWQVRDGKRTLVKRVYN